MTMKPEIDHTSKPTPENRCRTAWVELGEWDGKQYEFEGEFPIKQCRDGNLYVCLGKQQLPDKK